MTFRLGKTIPRVLKTITCSYGAIVQTISPKSFHTDVYQLSNARKNKPSSLIVHGFTTVKEKHKENFLTIIDSYKSNVREHQGCVEFIKAALKFMEEFGVDKDLETYKKLVDVMPKGKYVPTNSLQVLFQHYPLQQQLIVDLLHQMEHNGVIPDREMELILLNIFGNHGLPLKKFWRMMYWMPKFKYVNPWLVTDEILADPCEMAKFALNRMSYVDPSTKITVFRTQEIPDTIEDTWVVSAMSPTQEELLAALPLTESLFVEGPYKAWVANHTIDYFVLRGEVIKREIIEIDEDDISNISIPYHTLKKVGVPLTVHEQNDGTFYAMCVTGTSTKDSALSWIRYLQNRNPILSKVPVVFKLKSSTSDTLVEQSAAPLGVKEEPQKDKSSSER